MRYTINLDCKTSHVDRNGEVPILLRVSINGVHGYINTGKKIKEKNYDSEKKCVKSGIKGQSYYSSFITKQKEKIDTILSEFDKRGEVATIEKLKEVYSQETGKVKSECFYSFVENTIAWERNNTEITSNTLDNYIIHLNKLKTYRQKLGIHDINKSFLETYKSYILNTLKQAPNTAYHAMCFIRKYTKKLFDDGKIKPYPFATFEVGKNFETERAFLEMEEVTILHNLYDSEKLHKIIKKAKSKHAQDFHVGKKYQEVLRYFLVACYCGLRHSDIKTLCRADIQGDYIVKEMQKGRLERKKTVRIPIRKRLLSLLDMDNPRDVLFENPVMEGSQTNKYLKVIMKEARIDKHITFHCARHTFATNSLSIGITIEVISDILGHSELTTTQRYAKVKDRLREEQMDKWDEPVKDKSDSNNIHKLICPDCENVALEFQRGVIKLNNIPIVCPFCSKSSSHKLKYRKSITPQKIRAVA